MNAVLDASVVVRAALAVQPYHAEVRTWLEGVSQAFAPQLMPFEAFTAVRRLEAAGLLSRAMADRAAAEILRFRVLLRGGAWLHRESLRLARELAVSRTRDCAYLALAMREGCTLFTLDERFIRNAAPKGYPVRHPVLETV